jgi:hypothetical protein
MNAGDVLLIESSSIVPDPKFGLLPAEVDPVVFDLIKTATGNGITVVEPAGNNDNGSNLDAFRNGSGALSLTASSLPSGTPARSWSAPQARAYHTSDSGTPIMVVASTASLGVGHLHVRRLSANRQRQPANGLHDRLCGDFRGIRNRCGSRGTASVVGGQAWRHAEHRAAARSHVGPIYQHAQQCASQ